MRGEIGHADGAARFASAPRGCGWLLGSGLLMARVNLSVTGKRFDFRKWPGAQLIPIPVRRIG